MIIIVIITVMIMIIIIIGIRDGLLSLNTTSVQKTRV